MFSSEHMVISGSSSSKMKMNGTEHERLYDDDELRLDEETVLFQKICAADNR